MTTSMIGCAYCNADVTLRPDPDHSMTTIPSLSVASMKLSKDQYIEMADRFRDKAQNAHHEARKWMTRALVAEARLKLYDAREKANK